MNENKLNSSLFYLPQHRNSLLDRITNAYFKRSDNNSSKHDYSKKNFKKQNSQILPRSPKSKKSSNSEGKGNPLKSANNIYNKSKKREMRLKLYRKKYKMKRSQEEMSNCTFKPRLNKSTGNLDRNLRERKRIGTFELLYEKALEKESLKEVKLKRKEMKEIMQLKSKPSINKVSDLIVRVKEMNSDYGGSRKGDNNRRKDLDIFSGDFRDTWEEFDAPYKHSLIKKVRTIQNLSKRMNYKRTRSLQNPKIDRNLRLFELSKKRKAGRKKKFSFKPKINKRKGVLEGLNFFERVERFKEKKDENLKLAKLEKHLSTKFDRKTGQELFKPLLFTHTRLRSSSGRKGFLNMSADDLYKLQKSKFNSDVFKLEEYEAKIRKERNRGGRKYSLKGQKNMTPITKGSTQEDLLQDDYGCFYRKRAYGNNQGKKLKRRKKSKNFELSDSSYESNLASKNWVQRGRIKPKFLPKSLRNLDKLRRKTIQKKLHPSKTESEKLIKRKIKQKSNFIFALLDNDNDGLISAGKISIDLLDNRFLKILSPLLFELEELNQELNSEEFLESVKLLIKTLTPQDRHFFVFGEKKNNEGIPNFKPELNKNSLEMSKNLRPYGKREIYDYYINEKHTFLNKMLEVKELNDKRELSMCTFNPDINRRYKTDKEFDKKLRFYYKKSRSNKSICSKSTALVQQSGLV